MEEKPLSNEERETLHSVQKFYQNDLRDREFITIAGESEICRGSFGCYRNIVVKSWKFEKMNKAREVNTMAKYSNHPNILRFFGAFYEKPLDWLKSNIDTGLIGIVTEFMENSDLYKAIHSSIIFPPGLNIDWILQACHGLQYLHRQEIAHRDLKPKNMLLADNYKLLKICDFGMTKDYSKDVSITAGGLGTYQYLSPEKIQESTSINQFPKASDIYAMAISIWEILTRKYPFGLIDHSSICNMVLQNDRPDPLNIEDKEIRDFIINGWHQNPQQRPDVDSMVELFTKKREVYPKEIEMSIENTKNKLNSDFLSEWEKKSPSIQNILTDLPGIHTRINIPLQWAILATDDKKLIINGYMLISKHLVTAFKEFSKQQIEESWQEENDEKKILVIEKSYTEIYNKLRGILQEGYTMISNYDIRKNIDSSWETIHSFYKYQALSFIQNRKENIGKVIKFISDCTLLEEDTYQLLNSLKKGEYENFARSVVLVVEKQKELKNYQDNNKNLLMKFFDGTLHDRLRTTSLYLYEINSIFKREVIEYKEIMVKMSRKADGYVKWCLLMMKKCNILLDEGSIKALLDDVESILKEINKENGEAAKISKRLAKILGMSISTRMFGLIEVENNLRRDEGDIRELEKFLRNTVKWIENCRQMEEECEKYSTFNLENIEGNIKKEILDTSELISYHSMLQKNNPQSRLFGDLLTSFLVDIITKTKGRMEKTRTIVELLERLKKKNNFILS